MKNIQSEMIKQGATTGAVLGGITAALLNGWLFFQQAPDERRFLAPALTTMIFIFLTLHGTVAGLVGGFIAWRLGHSFQKTTPAAKALGAFLGSLCFVGTELVTLSFSFQRQMGVLAPWILGYAFLFSVALGLVFYRKAIQKEAHLEPVKARTL
jgi:hypothetical protein